MQLILININKMFIILKETKTKKNHQKMKVKVTGASSCGKDQNASNRTGQIATLHVRGMGQNAQKTLYFENNGFGSAKYYNYEKV